MKKIQAKLDDKAFDVATFIQKLSKVQDDEFENLMKIVKDESLAEGFDEEQLEGFIFDYCYNENTDLTLSEFIAQYVELEM